MARIPRVKVTPDWLAQATAAAATGGGSPALGNDQTHRLIHVLRLEAGATVEVFAEDGLSWQGQLTPDAGGWRLQSLIAVKSGREAAREATGAVTIACGWPRAKRADFLIEKLVELNVAVLQPLVFVHSERGERFGADKQARYQRLIAKACEQSRRNRPLVLAAPLAWMEFLPQASAQAAGPAAGCRLIATGAADDGAVPLAAALANVTAATPVTAVIGPEGGIHATEITAAATAGFAPVRLGPLTLRVETAALTVAAAVAAQRG